jgi:hypothetical protein
VFTTRNQLAFLAAFCKAYIQSERDAKGITIDLDPIVGGLTANQPGWNYSEERQQRLFKCTRCTETRFDILGDYGGCPKCNRRTSRIVIAEKLDRIQVEIDEADKGLKERHDREVEWERLLRCVSEFEAMATDLRTHLLRLPAVPSRKRQLKEIGFQGIAYAATCLEQWYGFDFLTGISADDRKFLNLMSQRRHIFTHKAGRVDQDYIDKTGDTSVRLHQNIRLRSNEIRRLLPLLRKAAFQLIDGVESIT